MEQERTENLQNEENVYRERPAWQVWAARLGLVIVIIGVILYYIHIARGGFSCVF